VDLLSDAARHGERIGHPLLIGVACTIRGFAYLQLGDAPAAEADAHTVLAVIKPHDVMEAARVGPRVLLGCARLASGDVDEALAELSEVTQAESPSVLLTRRQAVAEYAGALLAAGRLDEAVAAARRAVGMTAEDARSRVAAIRVLARALAATGEVSEARAVAAQAVRAAYGTQQASERPATDALAAALA
jgi:tetratricopeptide (TPR) repeat protein